MTEPRLNGPAVELLHLRELAKRMAAALEPFADFADPRGAFPKEMQITRGSDMAKRQLTMGDCYRAAEALGRKGGGQ